MRPLGGNKKHGPKFYQNSRLVICVYFTDNSKNMTDVSKRAIDTTAVVTEENKDGAVDAKPDEQKTDDVPTEKTPPPPPAFDEKVLMEMQYKVTFTWPIPK